MAPNSTTLNLKVTKELVVLVGWKPQEACSVLPRWTCKDVFLMSKEKKNSTKIFEKWRFRVEAVIQAEGIWILSAATVIHYMYGYGSGFFSHRMV